MSLHSGGSLYTFSQVGCVIQTKTGRETKTASACPGHTHPWAGPGGAEGTWSSPPLPSIRGSSVPVDFPPRPSEKCLRVSLTNTQNPLVGVRVRVGVGAVASSAWLDKWKFECQWQGVCTGQPVGAIYSSWWSWWQGVYGAAVECGYRQVLRQRYWRVV